MRVEVVLALPEQQELIAVEVPAEAVVSEAIQRSGIARRFPGVEIDALQVGVWGKPVERGYPLRDGDRVELYRPLVMDPREARRLKAGS